MSEAPPRLRCEGLRKAYPGVLALDNVDLQLAPGSVHALVGENGAGKSTLIKILAGAVSPDAGTFAIDGKPVHLSDPRTAQRLGIAVVYQEFNLVSHLSVSENIYLGRWPRRRITGLVAFDTLHQRAERLLEGLGIRLPVRETVERLSIAQQQMVEIAKALSLDARILILDEPSAVLTPHELKSLFSFLGDLRRRGVGIIYISHRLEEVFEIADCVTVLRDGRHVSTRPIEDVSRDGLILDMVGRALKDEFPPRTCEIGEVVLRVEDLSAEGRFWNVNLEVRAGEVLGITGLVGSGRSSLAGVLFGAVRATGGTLFVGPVRGPFSSPSRAMAAGVASLPEDRKLQGLMLDRPLRENVTLANRSAVSRWGFLQAGRERTLVNGLMTRLRIKAVDCDTIVNTLSGGNQQKVLLARWLSRPHKLVLFDEPTRGVDVGAKVGIYTLINELAAAGAAVVMISSELPEVIGMSDRIGIMHEGRLRGILDNRDGGVTQDRIMRMAFGEGAAT